MPEGSPAQVSLMVSISEGLKEVSTLALALHGAVEDGSERCRDVSGTHRGRRNGCESGLKRSDEDTLRKPQRQEITCVKWILAFCFFKGKKQTNNI